MDQAHEVDRFASSAGPKWNVGRRQPTGLPSDVASAVTCQFHPELLADLRLVGMREPPSYEELKQDDGARLFARLLYAGMQE